MKVALVDCRMNVECQRNLLKQGFFLIPMPASNNLPPPLASHPDMLVAKLGDNIITTADYIESFPHVFSDIREYAPHIKIHVTDEKFSKNYPFDAILNVLVMGKRVYIKKDSASLALQSLLHALGYKTVNTKQGYPACTVLPLSDTEAITSDSGLKETLTENGVHVTLIENGGISLPPYEYGFIGGACGVLEKTVYFIGDVSHHKNATKILMALNSCGMQHVSLSSDTLSDMGRIIFL